MELLNIKLNKQHIPELVVLRFGDWVHVYKYGVWNRVKVDKRFTYGKDGQYIEEGDL